MKYLYLDNIRGFQDSLIPLKAVNFLVGENSSGKTSLIAILNLLSSTDFWFNQEFNTDDYSFGNFDDIVSVNSKKRDHFSIGYIDTIKDEGKTSYKSALIKFIEKDGMPVVSRYYIYSIDFEMKMKFSKTTKSLSYKVDKSEIINTDSEFLERVFKKWITGTENGYKIVKKEDIVFNFKSALIQAPSFLVYYTSSALKDQKTIKLLTSYWASTVGHMAWIAPVRTNPKRTYDNIKLEFKSEGDHTPFLIKKFYDTKERSKGFFDFLKKFGRESALFKSVEILKYGKTTTSPFELRIILDDKPINICNVGYGVSQSLPIVVESFIRPEGTYFALQQPEVHLHPRAQAAFGDLFYNLSKEENKTFFIETHSDYMIDRFRLNYRKKSKNKPEAQILFFERTGKGNKIHSLEIDKKGDLPDDIPGEYREFFINEELDILNL